MAQVLIFNGLKRNDPLGPYIQQWEDVNPKQKVTIGDLMDELYRRMPMQKPRFKGASSMARRLVMLLIVDSDTRLKAEDALLYVSPGPFLTDFSDDELFLDLDPSVASLLKKHNEKRATIVDTKVSRQFEKEVCLEDDLEIDDLDKQVITLADIHR